MLVAGITVTVGWRPFVGPRTRPLTTRRFAPTPERLARGTYLVKHVTPCMECHAPHRWAERDPVERFRAWLRSDVEMTDEEEDQIASQVKKLLNDALQRAEESPQPDPTTLLEGVYATPEDLDTPHHK